MYISLSREETNAITIYRDRYSLHWWRHTLAKSVFMIAEVNQPPGRIIKMRMQILNSEAQRARVRQVGANMRQIH